jgi:hypothetical protein
VPLIYIIFIQINYFSFANFILNSGNLQLKCRDFICNIFNCLNEENKRFQIFSLFLFFFLSSLTFSLYPTIRI